MTLNHCEKGLHLFGTSHPLLRLCPSLFRNPVKVHLWPNHRLSRTEKAFQDNHILGIQTLSVSERVLDRILCLKEHKFIQLLLVWVHIKFHILEVTGGKTKTFTDL